MSRYERVGWAGARRAAALVLLVALAFGCTWVKRFGYAGPGRDRWQRPAEVVAALALPPAAQVADLGSGGGYFSFRLAEAVGPTGTVYAVDVDAGLNRWLEQEARRRGLGNVRVVLAAPDDPRLPAEGVDLVFTCNTYHHLQERSAYFARLRAFLRPGGRVAIVEYRDAGWIPFLHHATPRDRIVAELGQAGFRLAVEHHFLPRQSFLVFDREVLD